MQPVPDAIETDPMEEDTDVENEGVTFAPAEALDEGTMVQILSIGGGEIEVHVQKEVSIAKLKQAIAAKFDQSVFDFHLCVLGCEESPDDNTLVSALPVGDTSSSSATTKGKSVSMYMVKVRTLERYEEQGHNAWRQLALRLQTLEINDDELVSDVSAFLDEYPALINWQSNLDVTAPTFKPLLSFAVDSVPDARLRQKCVDELIERGARVHIRHVEGFLIDQAIHSGSAFADYLEKKKADLAAYDREAIAAWRNVSSKLCGETSVQVDNEDEMTSIVKEFCTKYPEMVNFQNNHAVNQQTDKPYGYFGYAPLMTFAGAQACRRRRHQDIDENTARKGSVEELLRHGARVDTRHGGHTSLEWMDREGSQLVGWLSAQLKAPMPAHEPFKLQPARLSPEPVK